MRIMPVFSGGHVKSFGAGLYGLADEAFKSGNHEIVLPKPSWQGLLNDTHIRITPENMHQYIFPDRPFIASHISRDKLTAADINRIASLYDDDTVIAVYGGDDSRSNALALMQHGIKTVVWPKTMDNDTDVPQFDFGFVDFVTDAVRETLAMRDQVADYRIFGVTATFARDMDHVPAAVAYYGCADMMIGGEDYHYHPEKIITIEHIVNRVHDILAHNERLTGARFGTAVISEGAVNIEGFAERISANVGANINHKVPYRASYDPHGHPKLQPGVLADYVSDLIIRHAGIKCNSQTITYQGRNGTPCELERNLGEEAGRELVRAINEGDFGICAAADYDPALTTNRGFFITRIPLAQSAQKISLRDFAHRKGIIPVDYERLCVTKDYGKLYPRLFGEVLNRDSYIPPSPELISVSRAAK